MIRIKNKKNSNLKSKLLIPIHVPPVLKYFFREFFSDDTVTADDVIKAKNKKNNILEIDIFQI